MKKFVKEWRKSRFQRRRLQKRDAKRAKADEECVGLNVDPEAILEMKKAIKSAVSIVNEKSEELCLVDKNRCLYSNVKKSVLKENIVFPEIFSGKPGEDICKFKEKLLQAVFDS